METNRNNLDDLIFENRNKAYGAYANRKNYGRYMFWALLCGTFIFLSIISVPLIANYISGNEVVISNGEIIVDVLPPPKPEDIEKIKPPEDQLFKKADPVFRPPVVTADTLDLSDLSDLMDRTGNVKVNDTSGSVVVEDSPSTNLIIDVEETQVNHVSVEEMPEFPGGEAGRAKYLSENTIYPQSAKEIGISGVVYVSFVVDENGDVVDVKLLRGIGGGCDEEALRVIRNMPRWKPGRQSGKAVRVIHSIPISFILH
jgi:protein TonB